MNVDWGWVVFSFVVAAAFGSQWHWNVRYFRRKLQQLKDQCQKKLNEQANELHIKEQYIGYWRRRDAAWQRKEAEAIETEKRLERDYAGHLQASRKHLLKVYTDIITQAAGTDQMIRVNGTYYRVHEVPGQSPT